MKQSQNQDPAGGFIRRWAREPAQVPEELIHEPWRMSAEQMAAGCQIGADYPAPILDHLAAAREARRQIGSVRRTAEARAEGQTTLVQHGSRRRGMSRARIERVGGRGRNASGERAE